MCVDCKGNYNNNLSGSLKSVGKKRLDGEIVEVDALRSYGFLAVGHTGGIYFEEIDRVVKTPEKLYTLKEEFKHLVVDKFRNETFNLKQWTFPVSMLDEVKEVEAFYTGHGFDFRSNEFTYSCEIKGKFIGSDFAKHLEKATKDFFKNK